MSIKDILSPRGIAALVGLIGVLLSYFMGYLELSEAISAGVGFLAGWFGLERPKLGAK